VNDTSKKPGIEVQLYRIIYNGNEPADDEIYTESNLVGTYKLNNVNNYEAVIKTGELSGYNDTDAQKYRYYVKEITDISDNTVSYYNNGTDGVAVITVTNKSTVTETASYVLPSTGSVGTRKLLIAGIALVSFGLAAVGIKLKRRNYEN
jgi:LPXTG-motif cell wall-anchored protein